MHLSAYVHTRARTHTHIHTHSQHTKKYPNTYPGDRVVAAIKHTRARSFTRWGLLDLHEHAISRSRGACMGHTMSGAPLLGMAEKGRRQGKGEGRLGGKA